MADVSKYAAVRQEIINMLRIDLVGPSDENEVLYYDSPNSVYITGKLEPRSSESDNSYEQEMDTDPVPEGNYPAREGNYGYSDEDNDDDAPVKATPHAPSSIGISFYIEIASTPTVNIDVTWGDYVKGEVEIEKDGRTVTVPTYTRQPRKETVTVEFKNSFKNRDYLLNCDPGVCLHISKINIKKRYSLVTAFLIDKRSVDGNDIGANMFQVNIRAYAPDNSGIFLAEHDCRDVLDRDRYYFAQRPVFGRGRGCAAAWGDVTDGKASYIESDFIPQYEIPGVSAEIPELDNSVLSMNFLGNKERKAEIANGLGQLADLYEKWIHGTLVTNPQRENDNFRKICDNAISKCSDALRRIREGIKLLEEDDIALEAFCFMNKTMLMQNSISRYAEKHGSGQECTIDDYTDYTKAENDFIWRPFQIAFILMNLNAIVDPMHRDREIVDLLYFPTGGGKTEAYLGLMAFVIANRRLRSRNSDEMDRSGGVAIILRYTLRLLTTQQRDRITRMILAADLIRRDNSRRYGDQPISIGFWVGGQLTPNKFDDLKIYPNNSAASSKSMAHRRRLSKQILTCPYCGSKLTENQYDIDTESHSVKIYCSDRACRYSKGNGRGKIKYGIPIYLVDEEIYEKCPTVILATVDKFANLPFLIEANALFGRVDRICSRHGYVAIGEEHAGSHRRTETLGEAVLENVSKKFLPPELIIQDELHLITGPLGTIYGAYETLIESLCSYSVDGRKIKPKYVVSTATIRNAEAQARCLYGRKDTAQFPPDGVEIGDSFFIREQPVSEKPFRKYIGVSATGPSMKTALLRIYAIILQKTFMLSKDENYIDCIDPYYTLVGYYNSIRELGGAARLLQDDIPDRMKTVQNKYKMGELRQLDNKIEITSRIQSYEIPDKLKQLETKCSSRKCLDVAIATNMIAVGMDVGRLGLMVVTGQPKQNSEYIQATSRIGREFPGLVVTLYNPYRPRDMSHYENFTGYHAQIYRFIEGTTATPFSARARDRVMHALIIAAIRLLYPEMGPGKGADNIKDLSDEKIQEVKKIIFDRLNIVKPTAKSDAESEIDTFIIQWKNMAGGENGLCYYSRNSNVKRLMNYYGQEVRDSEKPVLGSMRDVEKAAMLYYYLREG